MGYELDFTKAAASTLSRLERDLAIQIVERLRELAADPRRGRSIVAPVPCMLFGFTMANERERISVSATYEFSQDGE